MYNLVFWYNSCFTLLKNTMRNTLLLLSFFILYSCIPLRIAPTIKDDKLVVAKKFKRNLPRHYALIFEDPKDSNEFYNYVNIKYQLDNNNVGWNVPITIQQETLFLSYYEVEIPTKTINLIPIFIDATLENKGHDPIFSDQQFSRIGSWYLALTVLDSNMRDCLNPKHELYKKTLEYVRDIKTEYLNTTEYVQSLLVNKKVY